MANLLTVETKKLLARQQREKKIMVVASLVTFWLLIGLVFNLSLWFNLETQKKILALNTSTSTPAILETDSLPAKRLKEQLGQLGDWGLNQAWSSSLAYLQTVQPPTIEINQIVGLKTDNGQTVRLALAGNASSRQALVNFVDQLERDKFFKQVDLPVSYLLSSADNQFIINLEVEG